MEYPWSFDVVDVVSRAVAFAVGRKQPTSGKLAIHVRNFLRLIFYLFKKDADFGHFV